MKEKNHTNLSRTGSDQLPLFPPILKKGKITDWSKIFKDQFKTLFLQKWCDNRVFPNIREKSRFKRQVYHG